MDCARAHEELGWRPSRTSTEVLQEFLAGMREGAGAPTEPMHGRKAG